MAIEITNDDFRPEDWDPVLFAGFDLMQVIGDIAYHNIAAGDGWSPFAKDGDVAALAAEIRNHLSQVEDAVKKAKSGLVEVERVARLRAARRVRAAAD